MTSHEESLSEVRFGDVTGGIHGSIIEEGKHEGLMAQGGHYAELYNTYFRHQSLAYIEGFVPQLAGVPAGSSG